jgi:redox-sensitive bicupin YhaK (pirin superfamily)
MSNFESDREIDDCCGSRDDLTPVVEVLEPRAVLIGPRQEVLRALPNKERRTIGAWCFVDHYGPHDISGQQGMRVPPHPHSGLQTVSWLLEGEIQHRDSLGSDAVVLPGQLNLMTSGPGIAHSEESAPGHSATLHGIQLWVALPESARHHAPRAFSQYRELPVIVRPGLRATVVTGQLEGAVSPALSYTPLVGAELVVTGEVSVAVNPAFEYGVLAIDDGLVVAGQRLGVGEIAYVGGGREVIALSTGERGTTEMPSGDREDRGAPEVSAPATEAEARRGFLLGGVPFEEELVMWWNFIGRSHDEIVEFRRAWNDGPSQASSPGEGAPGSRSGGQFGVVVGFEGERLMAPPMPTVQLRSRPRHR